MAFAYEVLDSDTIVIYTCRFQNGGPATPADDRGEVVRVTGFFRGEEYGLEAVIRDQEMLRYADAEAYRQQHRDEVVNVFATSMEAHGVRRVIDGGSRPYEPVAE
jgi:hypothetical protein